MIAVHWIDRSRYTADSQHKRGWRLRRAASRALLAHALDSLDAGPFTVLRQSGRRPELYPATHQFSVSHSGDLTVCAIADRNIGVDVELLETSRTSRLAANPPSRLFTEVERREIALNPERLVQIFTLKEAWSKYQGVGLGIGLGSFDEHSIRALYDDLEFTAVDVPGAACTVCHHAGEAPVVSTCVLSAEQVHSAELVDRMERST